MHRGTWVSVLAAGMVCGALSAWAVDLVKDGTARAVIVVAPDVHAYKPPEKGRPGPEPSGRLVDVNLAARELVEHIEKMSGAKLEIIPTGPIPAGRIPIYLDQAAPAALDELIRKTSTDGAAFALSVSEKAVSVRGLTSDGTLIGVYELLEQLGVRWFMPGDFGRVVPKTATVTLSRQETVQGPSFHARNISGTKSAEWQRRVRMGGPRFPSAHGVDMPKTHSFEAKPECYALIGGVRKNRQLCVSNPETVKAAIETTRAYFRANPDSPWIGMGPHDGRGFCECENCKALDGGDWDPFAATMSMTDRYLWFFDQILQGIADEFPEKKIGFYSYAAYNRPPRKVKPNPRIIPAFAPITICRIHGLGNPICPEKDKYYRWLVQEWGKILPEIYDRGYWFNLSDPGLLFPMVHRIRAEIPIAHDLGITGWRVECLAPWGSESPSLYVAAKLMWNHTADVDALLKDYFDRFFGPASGPMSAYFTLLDTRIRDTDVHTGSSYDMPILYPPAIRKQAQGHLDQAKRLATEGDYAKRVEAFQQVFNYTDAFCVMMESRSAHQWPAAAAALKRFDQLLNHLSTAYDVELVTKKYGQSYMSRFFRSCTEQGYERAVTKGVFLAGMSDEWDFQLDLDGLGESLQLYASDLTGGNWSKLKTSTSSWSNQGLRYVKSDGWYRQRIKLPAFDKGRKVMLWFGGVDEKARVWINGKFINDSPGRAFVPFEFDVTDAVNPAQENLIVVRVTNKTLNEVGTGGITAPVFFWAPSGEGHKPSWGGEDVTPIEFK